MEKYNTNFKSSEFLDDESKEELFEDTDMMFQTADSFIDETYWNDESPAGEVEKLLHDFPQNQELIRNIGASYYQIIYPTQQRRHEKMGISTRETAPTKISA
ncbi:hypothetical protein PGB90_008870 [Kerria lacca]